jgi:hypothetical protein
MKKLIFSVLLLMFIGIVTACNDATTMPGTLTPTQTTTAITVPTIDVEGDKVEKVETLAHVTLSNSYISAKFDLDNGSMVSLINVPVGTDYLFGTTGGNWAMIVDVSTNNPFMTDYQGESAALVTSRNQMPDYELSYSEDIAIITFTYDVSFNFKQQSYSGIRILQTITLLKGSSELDFAYTIENNSEKEITVCAFTGAQLSGLKDSENGELSLFWSNKEGKIYDRAISKIMNVNHTNENLVNVYPGLYSTQLIQLYNDVESLYYMVEDDTREYKIAQYGDLSTATGYDYNGVGVSDKISLSFTQFPFVGSNDSKALHKTVIGVGLSSSWYQGADRYRAFLEASDMLNDYEDFPENWGGFIPLVGSHYGSKHFSSYTTVGSIAISYAGWINDVNDSSGVRTEVILGWNEGGFDAMYPDYDFATGEGFGGEEGFQAMANEVHANGNLFLLHMNSRIADMAGNWSQTIYDETTGLNNYYHAGVKRAGFRSDMSVEDYENYLVAESYGTATMYYVMSSASEIFREQILSVARRLRENGANGIWFDQLMERDAYLDYDENHAFSEDSTPATLYGEGYLAIFRGFEEIGKTIRSDQPWIINVGGGAGDAFAKYIDVYGGNWGRKLGARDNSADSTVDSSGTENSDRHIMSPELSKYTVPAIYIGQAGAGTLAGQADEFARAFILGSPFLVEQITTTTPALLAVYDYYPDIFYRGVFKDRLGLSVSDDNVIASILLSQNNDSFAVQLYNYNSEATGEFTISIQLDKFGITGEIVEITNLFTGTVYTMTGDILTLSLGAQGFTSIHFDLNTD